MHRIWLDYEQVDSFSAIYVLLYVSNGIASMCVCRMTLKSNNREVDKSLAAKERAGAKGAKEIEKKNSFYSHNSIITTAAAAIAAAASSHEGTTNGIIISTSMAMHIEVLYIYHTTYD